MLTPHLMPAGNDFNKGKYNEMLLHDPRLLADRKPAGGQSLGIWRERARSNTQRSIQTRQNHIDFC